MAQTKTETYEAITNQFSQAYDQFTRGSKVYDDLIAYGNDCKKVLAKANPKIAYKISQFLKNTGDVLMPAAQASVDNLKTIGNYVANLGKGAMNSLIKAGNIYAASELYKEAQEMYKTYSTKETEDRTERINAEKGAESKGLFGRLFGKMKNCAENAKSYGKLENMAWDITSAGHFSTPLQAYALKNGDAETYMKLVPRTKKEKPFINFGAGVRFDTAKDFANWLSGIAEARRQMQYAQYAQEFYKTQTGSSETNTRTETVIPSEDIKSKSPCSKRKQVRGLLSA